MVLFTGEIKFSQWYSWSTFFEPSQKFCFSSDWDSFHTLAKKSWLTKYNWNQSAWQTAPSTARWLKKIKCVWKIVQMNWTMWLTWPLSFLWSWWIWCWWILHSRFNLVHLISFPNQRNFPAAQKFSSRNLIYQICTWTHLGCDWSLFHFRWQPNLSGSVNCRLEPVNLIQYNFENISYNFESSPTEILWFWYF